MSALELYARQAIQTKGTQHSHAIDSLRRYINLTSIADLILYINTITDPEVLRTLQEAGMRGEAHSALIRRMNMLMSE